MLNEQESKKDVMNHLTGSEDIKSKVNEDLNTDKTSMDELKASMGVKKEAISVHSMPGKFVEASQKKSVGGASSGLSGGSSKKVLLIAIGLILFIIIVIAGVLWFANKNIQSPNNQPVAVINENTNDNTNDDINQNDNTNDNQNQVENINDNTNDNVNQNDNTNDNQPQNINDNTNDNPDNLVIFDADNDGLSYEEELVFSTNPNLEDTDKDGYKDGQEIINLFNPLLPSKDLLTSGLVIRFNNSIYNYLLLRPKVWLAKAEGGNLAEILILPNTETGESFSISSISNTSGLSLTEALVQNEDILGSAANFDSTFAMMLNSFKWSVVDNNPSEEDES